MNAKGQDPATGQGIKKALRAALDITRPLLIDKAADDAFSTMIDRLRREHGTEGGKA